MNRWINFIFSHSIFVAFCAMALCWQTFILFQLPLNFNILCFVLFSTLSSYNGYWLLSRFYFSRGNIVATLKRAWPQVVIFLLATAIVLFFLLRIPQAGFSAVALSALLTIIYSLPLWPITFLKNIPKPPLLKPVFLAAAWAVVTVLIPVAGKDVSFLIISLLIIARFLLVFLLSLIFDRRDKEMDEIKGLRTLATNLSDKQLRIIMAVSLISFLITGFLLRFLLNEPIQMLAFLFTAILVLLIYKMSQKKHGYYFYYFLVDGIMLFSPLFTAIGNMIK